MVHLCILLGTYLGYEARQRAKAREATEHQVFHWENLLYIVC
jgi:hypothetical protein